MKIALGTVQFGQNYGIANKSGQVDKRMASSILHLANQAGINTLDTAIDYGNSEKVLGMVGVQAWKVVTKLPPVPDDCDNIYEWVSGQVQGSLMRMGLAKLDGLLLHRPEQLLKGFGPELYSALQFLKLEGLVSKVGISVYETEELDRLFERYFFDLVQAPLNILDQRLVMSGWTANLEQAGVELHTRSAFLQGLLLMPSNKRPGAFDSWAEVWREWDRWLQSTGLTPLQACLHYLNSIPGVSRIVVGVDTVHHLREILQASDGQLKSLPTFPEFIDKRIINPSLWNSLKD